MQKEINLIHLKKALFGNEFRVNPVAIGMNYHLDEFMSYVKEGIENNINCMVFIKKKTGSVINSTNIKCLTTNKSEQYLFEEIPKIIEKNEKIIIDDYNNIVNLYLYSFGQTGTQEYDPKLFYLNNFIDYNFSVSKSTRATNILTTSLLISTSLSMIIYLAISLILNIYYKN